MCAIDAANGNVRDRIIAIAQERYHALFLGCGEHTLRFRPPQSVTGDDLDEAVRRLGDAADDVTAEQVSADAESLA